MSEARQVHQGFALVYLPCFWQNAPLHQTENIFKVSQKLVCEKRYNCSHALHLKKSPFTSGWKYCQCSTKTCLWKVIQLLWYLENIFSLIWRGNFVRSKASTPRHNIVKVKQKFVCKKWYNSSHWCTGLASEKFPFYIRLKIFSCVKWLSIFTDKFFYATLASTKLPRCTCLASEKLARGYALPCI